MKIFSTIKRTLIKKRVTCLCVAAAVALSVCAVKQREYLMNLVAPDAVATAAAKKKLPIYCVDTGTAKRVAVSFDAAWGAC